MIFASSITGNHITLTPLQCLLFAPILEFPILQMRLLHTICVSIQWVAALNLKTSPVPLFRVKSCVDAICKVEKRFHTLYHTIPYL